MVLPSRETLLTLFCVPLPLIPDVGESTTTHLSKIPVPPCRLHCAALGDIDFYLSLI